MMENRYALIPLQYCDSVDTVFYNFIFLCSPSYERAGKLELVFVLYFFNGFLKGKLILTV